MPVDDDVEADPTWSRLEHQIRWHDQQSRTARRAHVRYKITEILLAASIPCIAGFQGQLAQLWPAAGSLAPAALIALMGVAVVAIESVLHLGQHQQRWIGHRVTHEALEHEKYLFLAGAGPYGQSAHAQGDDLRARLAERIEALLVSAHARRLATAAPGLDRAP